MAGIFGPLHQQPASPGISEPRAPCLVAAAAEHIVEAGQTVTGADEAIALELLAGLDSYACAGRSRHGNARQERTILAEIIEPHARFETSLLHGDEGLHRADRRGCFRAPANRPPGPFVINAAVQEDSSNAGASQPG